MAVGIERKQGTDGMRATKRKRDDQTECSFTGTGPVEVRSSEEGLLGSWHQATVIASDRQLSGIKYDIKYDHLLVDDGSDHIVSPFFVPLRTDGVDCSDANQRTPRGVIRPVPPKLKFTRWNIPYGTCVDVNHMDCWWEGVIFDHEDGAEERKIFFPDQGDEMVFHFSSLRITQDWIDDTDTWQRRGTWLFLELIEEYEQECFVPVSLKQMWYDLREKEGFQKLGDWTSSFKALWEEMLLEVIGGNIKIAVNHLIQAIDCEGTHKSLEFVKPSEDADIDCEDELVVPLAAVPDDSLKENMSLHPKSSTVMSPQGISDVVKLGSPPVNEVSNVNLSSESNLPCHDKSLCVLSDPSLVLPTTQDGISFITCDEGFSSSNSQEIVGSCSSSLHGETRWLPVGADTLSGADFCPDAVTEYLRKSDDRRPHNVVINDVKKYLAHLKWKIDFMTDKGRVRLRFTSPDGKLYYSLRQVCLDLSKSDSGIVSPVSQFEQRDMHSFPKNSSLPLPEQETENMDACCSSDIPSDAKVLNVKPEYCPEAIAEWCNFESKSKFIGNSKQSKVTLRAKKHLAALGWVFWRRSYKGKRTLYYRSPTGRCYCSLRQACRHVIDKSNSKGTPESCTSHLEKTPELPKVRIEKIQPARVLRSSKRVQRAIVPNPLHHNPRTVLSWLIENNVLLPRAKGRYIVKKGGRPVVEGRIARNGIKCNCCGKVYSLSGFQVHATKKCRKGTSSGCLPAASIFLEDGRSLFDCQRMIFDEKMRNSGRELADRLNNNWHQGENDYICSVCHSAGKLILCDQCPSAFHPRCLGMKDVPPGAWFCPSCCCRICGENKLKKDAEPFVDGSVTCVQCERKYHVWCLRNGSADQQDCFAKENWLCSQKCEAVCLGLRKLLGKQIPVRADKLTWTLYKYTQSSDPNASENDSLTETYSKLSIALDVMHECFEPFEEPLTRRDLMKDVIFSERSELNRLNFRGFYTAILEKDGDLVTVATVRVYGDRVAEVPLIGTRFQYRRLGMCRILMNLLEEKLLGLGVQRLVLPAVPSVLQTWTGSFGFSKMTPSKRLEFIDHTFLDFQGTIMCQKLLMKTPSTKSNLSREIFNAAVGGSSAISAVVQTEQITQSESMEQGRVGVLAGNGSTGAEDPIHKVNRSAVTNKRSGFDSDVVWKTYKRRKKSLIQN